MTDLLGVFIARGVFFGGIVGMLFSASYIPFHKTTKWNQTVAMVFLDSIFAECALGWLLSGISDQPGSWLIYFITGTVFGLPGYLMIDRDGRPKKKGRP